MRAAAMISASQRTQEWRQAKRDAGYGLLSLWIPHKTLALLRVLAAQRRQSMEEVFIDALAALEQVEAEQTDTQPSTNADTEEAIHALKLLRPDLVHKIFDVAIGLYAEEVHKR